MLSKANMKLYSKAKLSVHCNVLEYWLFNFLFELNGPKIKPQTLNTDFFAHMHTNNFKDMYCTHPSIFPCIFSFFKHYHLIAEFLECDESGC